MYRGDWLNYKPYKRDKNRKMIIQGYEVERYRIPDYFEGDNMRYLELYINYKHFGWPFTGQWAEQPAHVFDVIKTLLIEEGKYGR